MSIDVWSTKATSRRSSGSTPHLCSPSRRPEHLRELFVRTRLKLPRETMLSFFDPDPTVEVTPILGEIAVPVLVTHGSEDRLICSRPPS